MIQDMTNTTLGYSVPADYLTPDDVQQLVPGLTRNYLAQLRFKGQGPRFLKPSPRKVYYRRADVIDWLEASEQTITSRIGE